MHSTAVFAYFAHSLSHLIKENFKHFRCQFVPTFRRGQYDDSCQFRPPPSPSPSSYFPRHITDHFQLRQKEGKIKVRKRRNGLIKLKPFRACQGQLAVPSANPRPYRTGLTCQTPEIFRSKWLKWPSHQSPRTVVVDESLVSTWGVLISKVFAIPSCFRSNIKNQRN